MASKYYYEQKDEELRIVMVGKTGNGKSATGNTILGRQCFESKFSAKSMTVDCSKGKAVVEGQHIAVIDTPGLFDTRFGMEKTMEDVSQCISYGAPGPHVFLVVIRLGRFTEEEKQTVQKIQEIFGQAADKYSMVLFTGGDLLEGTTVEDFLGESLDMQELVARCEGQYHVFNNKLADRSQVTELLQKIRNIVQKNGGSHYTNKMFQEAEKAVEQEKQRILREKERQICKKREELEKRIKQTYEIQMGAIREQLRQQEVRERERRCEEEDRIQERNRERIEIEAERRRDREEKERALQAMREQHERKLREERRWLQERYNSETRERAEKQSPYSCTIC